MVGSPNAARRLSRVSPQDSSTGACNIEMGTDPRTPYDVLGLEKGQGDDVAIKRAYKIAIMKWHPDKNMDNVDEATEKIKSVVAAYECIGTAGARLKGTWRSG